MLTSDPADALATVPITKVLPTGSGQFLLARSSLERYFPIVRILQVLILAGLVLAGCATAPKMNRLNVGMTKKEVISALGKPSSTAAPGGGVELLRYRLSPTGDHAFYGRTEEYFVKLVNGTVSSYGKMGDFDSTKDPTLDLNIKNR